MSGSPTRPRRPDRERAADPAEQRASRALIVALHAAVRAIRLYPVEHSAVQKAVGDLTGTVSTIAESDGTCELRRIGDYLFVNETRLRLTLDNYAAVAHVLGLLREAGIGGIRMSTSPSARSWNALLAFLQSPPVELPDDERLALLERRLSESGESAFEISLPVDDAGEGEGELDQKERARQTYVRSLDVTREVMSSARLGRSPSLKRVKRAVQGIVDIILSDSASMLGLTTLREFDEYTFVHSVNVCILATALGRRMGLSKLQLLDLGLAALLHDIGKSRVSLAVLNKRGHLDERERAELQTHTWQGVLALFALPAGTGRPWRPMLAAFEHHMRTDLSGYPRPGRPRRLSLFSRIIAVADSFDAATTTRVYQDAPWTPADVVRAMRDNTRLGLDATIVKAFINLTGIYPVGTIVRLDTLEVAIVLQASADATALSRPLVRLLSDPHGNRVVEPQLYDLTERGADGQHRRTIIRSEDPERYAITISEYFA